jgi:hypothetical protein
MKYTEVNKDLFTVSDSEYSYAHCIASDIGMGAGIAVPMNAKYNLKPRIRNTKQILAYPTCIYTAPVFNLITKPYSGGKPTLETLTASVQFMKEQAIKLNITKLAMPKIGCGLDRLKWVDVSQMLKDQFADTDIELLVCIYP